MAYDINSALERLEKNLKDIDSARQQVEKTITSSNNLQTTSRTISILSFNRGGSNVLKNHTLQMNF